MPQQPWELARSNARRNAAARLTEVVGAPVLKRARAFADRVNNENPELAQEVRALTATLFEIPSD